MRAYPTHLPWFRRRRSPPRAVYLSFDDGPTPGVTEAVLEELARHEARASFFCLGQQAEAHPELVRALAAEGHGVGNHGHTHLDGWRVPWNDWRADMARGEEALTSILGQGPRLRRPPYGHLPPAALLDPHWRRGWVFWTHLPGDFDPAQTCEDILRRCDRGLRPGSILVLHDSPKAAPSVLSILPALLSLFRRRDLLPLPLL